RTSTSRGRGLASSTSSIESRVLSARITAVFMEPPGWASQYSAAITARRSTMARYGMTSPLDGIPLAQQRDWIRELADLGYSDLWSAEAGATDGFTPLALASQWAPEARLGCAILPAYTRGPALLAMSAASLASAA